MDLKDPKRKSKYRPAAEHKREKRRRFSSPDSSEGGFSSMASGSDIDKVGLNEDYSRKELKRKNKEKKHKHKKEKLKKKKKQNKKNKTKKHKHQARQGKDDDKSVATEMLDTKPTKEEPALKRVLAPMTKEEYEKQQSVMKHVLDPDTGRYRLIKGDGEVMEEIVSHSRHKEINKQATKGDGATFQRILGLGK